MFDEYQLGLYEGKMNERERIIELLVPIAGKCHLCDYDAANVVELIKGENE